MKRFPVDVPESHEVTSIWDRIKGCLCYIDVKDFSLSYPWSETAFSLVPSFCDAGIITIYFLL